MKGLKIGDKVYVPARWPGDGINGVREFTVTRSTPKQIKANAGDYEHTFSLCDFNWKVFLTPESLLLKKRDQFQSEIDSLQEKIDTINKQLFAWKALTKEVAPC